SWIVRVEHLAFRPFLPTVARGATILEDRPSSVTRCRVSGLRQERSAHCLHPQRLGVKGITRPLRDAVVVDGGIGWRRGTTCCSAAEDIAGKATSPLHPAGVVVEVRVAATGGAPQHYSLIIRVILGEERVKGERLAGPIGKDPGHPISQAVRVTGAAAAPAIA